MLENELMFEVYLKNFYIAREFVVVFIVQLEPSSDRFMILQTTNDSTKTSSSELELFPNSKPSFVPLSSPSLVFLNSA